MCVCVWNMVHASPITLNLLFNDLASIFSDLYKLPKLLYSFRPCLRVLRSSEKGAASTANEADSVKAERRQARDSANAERRQTESTESKQS